MACIKIAQRPVLIASVPESPYLAAGTTSGTAAVDERFSASATIEIYRLDLEPSVPDLPLRAATPAPRRFNRLCWSRPVAAQGDSFSLGLLAGGLCDGSVALWNPLTLISPEGQAKDALVARLVNHTAPVCGLAFSELTPTRLASGAGPGEVHLWDLDSPSKPTMFKTVQSSAQDEISYLAWNTKSPNMLASTSNNGMTVVWDLREQKQSTSFSDSDRRKCSVLEWNPDISDQLIVASDDDNYPSLKVWDLRKTISPRQEFVGHSKGVTAISWCPYDSSFLLSCSKDNRTLCWDTISGKIINELPSSSSGIFDLHWCRNVPNVIAASSLDGKIGIYKLSSLDTAGKSAVGGPETIQSATEYQAIDEVANRCSNKASSSLAIEAVLSAVPRKSRTPTTRTSSIKTAAVVKPTTASSIITRSMKSVASEKNKVCIVYNPCMLKHQGYMTNEVPGRIDAIMKKLKQDGLLKKCDIVDAHAVDFKHVLAVHTKEYFKVLLDLPLGGKEKEDAHKIFFGTDIKYCSDSKDAILAAAGAIIQGCHMVVTGQYKHAFAAIRPPGHHASRNKGSGFCFINNIALGARYLIKEKLAEKVMIVDFDYHHGDGTQSIFFDDDHVLTFSIHRDGVYPNSTEQERKAKCGDYIGIGKGEGFNVNVNLTEPYGDGDMLAIFKHILVPVVKSYSPDYILVSAGFDAALGDDVGDCKVTPEGYSTMTSILSNIGNKKLVLALEGGYGERSLSRSVSACVKSLVATGEGFHEKVILRDKKLKVGDSTWKTIDEVHGHLLPHWPILKGHSIPQEVLKRLAAKPAAH